MSAPQGPSTSKSNDGDSFVHFCSLRLQHLHTAAFLQPLSLEKVESRVSQLLCSSQV